MENPWLKNTTPKAVKHLRAAIQSDYSYAWAWHCNIACPAMDEGIDHTTANKIAARCMYTLFGVDTSQPPS